MSDMQKPDYQHIYDQAIKAYDVIAALTFETKEGGKLISKVCTTVAELAKYARTMKNLLPKKE